MSKKSWTLEEFLNHQFFNGETLSQHQVKGIFVVGGSVRDHWICKQELKPEPICKDIDLAIEAESFEQMQALANAVCSNIYETRPEFWTIRGHLRNGPPVDFVLCRKDGDYTDGRRPNSVSSGTILEDLARRDFTMNAMAINLITNELLDPFNGREDIKRRTIRTVGNPIDRFSEDALRIIRAIRFSCLLRFIFEVETHKAIHELPSGLKTNLASLSVERVRTEFHTMATKTSLGNFLYILSQFRWLPDYLENKGIWFLPTQEQKK